MNSEAVNAICRLYKKWIAANNQFHPRTHLRLHFFGARLILIAKKDGGTIMLIATGTIFHKLIGSIVMCNLKEKLSGALSLCSVKCSMPGGAESIVH